MDNIIIQSPQHFTVNHRIKRSTAGPIKSLQLKENQPLKKDSAALKKACTEMESFFIYYLFKEMRATIPKSGLLNSGKGEEIYQSMIDSQLSKELAGKGGIGLSSAIYDQLVEKEDPSKNINEIEIKQKINHGQLNSVGTKVNVHEP